jgi:RNA polymerase sigma factor (sigma-70 family)
LTDSLEHIIKGCVAGKRDAQEALYRMYSGKMWAVCQRYARNYDEAKDILHDGFMKIFDKIAQFEGRGHFEGWIRRVMVNTALNEYRKQRYLNIDAQYSSVKDEATFDNIECNISAEELMNLIKELPPQYKTVFNLFAIEGYSHKEISELLGISEGTSKSNLSRARSILQKNVATLYESQIKLG